MEILLASAVNVALVLSGQAEFGPETKKLGSREEMLYSAHVLPNHPTRLDDPQAMMRAVRRARQRG